MTTEQKIIRAKVGLLELAKQLGNVSQACKMMGYSREDESCDDGSANHRRHRERNSRTERKLTSFFQRLQRADRAFRE